MLLTKLPTIFSIVGGTVPNIKRHQRDWFCERELSNRKNKEPNTNFHLFSVLPSSNTKLLLTLG
jgi:hypothetical protein